MNFNIKTSKKKSKQSNKYNLTYISLFLISSIYFASILKYNYNKKNNEN